MGVSSYVNINKSKTLPRTEVYVVLLSFALFYCLQIVIRSSAHAEPLAGLGVVVASAIAAIPFANVHYRDLSRLTSVLIRGIGVLLFVLTLSDSLIEAAWPATGALPHSALFFRGGAAVSILSLLLAFSRPGFLFPALIYYDLSRRLFARVTGLDHVTTDYLNLSEIGEFVLIGSFVTLTLFGLEERLGSKEGDIFLAAKSWLKKLAPGDIDELRRGSLDLIWSVGIGAHLGNYFWSGIIKLKLDWTPWDWALFNETHLGILTGLERGSPLLSSPVATQLFYSVFAYFAIIANIIVLLAQVLAPFAVARVRFLLWLALFYDFFHIAVFFTISAMFWTWIGVNVIVVICCSQMSEEDFTPMMKTAAFLTAIFGTFLFDTAHLGWFDSRSVLSEYFVAETADGRTARVPNAFFMTPLSYTVGHFHLFVPPGHFPWTIGGAQFSLQSARDANSCGLPKVGEQNAGPDLRTVETIVKNNHLFMTTYPLLKQTGLFYLFPHHMFSDPFYYDDFNRIPVSDIVRYRYVVDSVCLSLKNGVLVRDIKKRSEYPIDVQ